MQSTIKHLLTLVVASLTVACLPHRAPQMPIPELTVATAEMRYIPTSYDFVSVTEPIRSYVIQPRVTGFLRTINFQYGMLVKRNDVIFTIDPAPFRTQVAQARAALSSAKAAMVNAQANYNRCVPLAAINAISTSELDSATATLMAAREQVESARAMLDDATIKLGYCTIKAPATGIIAPTAASVGDYVGEGTNYQTLTSIYFDDTISVNLSLPSKEYLNIINRHPSGYNKDSLVHQITLRLADGTTYSEKGFYRYTAPLVDSQSGSVVLNVLFKNDKGQIKGGEFARVRASIGEPMPSVVIPARAVSEIQGTYGVYVVNKGDTLSFRRVNVGRTVGDMWIITNGLTAGERVITDGLQKAKSGARIKVKK